MRLVSCRDGWRCQMFDVYACSTHFDDLIDAQAGATGYPALGVALRKRKCNLRRLKGEKSFRFMSPL